MDGSGYPDGLKGSRIPLEARSTEWALQELDRHAGTLFDPEFVRLLVELLRKDRDLLARLRAHRIPDAA